MAAGDLANKKAEIEALINLVKEGNQDAFAQVYDIFIDQIYRYVFYKVNAVDVEDLVEMAFLKAWENIGKYRYLAGKNSFSAWLFRITHNLVVDYYRSKKDRDFSELKLDIASKDRMHSPIDRAERGFDNKILRKAITNLKKNYRDIIVYKFVNELSNEEISLILGKSEGSLRTLQHRALKALREEFDLIGIKYVF